jgi:AraC-like DNA-binding protein
MSRSFRRLRRRWVRDWPARPDLAIQLDRAKTRKSDHSVGTGEALLFLDHKFGRFDRRRRVGPRRFPHYDLLWLHDGAVRLAIGAAEVIDIHAPNGVLIAPDTPFEGAMVGGSARASICHFLPEEGDGMALPRFEHGFRLCDPACRAEMQALVRHAVRLAETHPDDHARRLRVLAVLIDAFAAAPTEGPTAGDALVDGAWRWAADTIGAIRTIADVAAYAGLSESRFRARHAAVNDDSAGARLKGLRLAEAERLLAATDRSVAAIARDVGYGHAETLNAVFKLAYGMTPGRYRAAQML